MEIEVNRRHELIDNAYNGMVYIGIDPGKMGGIVSIDDKNRIIEKMPMPLVGKKEELDISALSDFLKFYKNNFNVMAALEDVHSIHGSSADANFQFGRILGQKEAIIICNKISYQKVAPKTWQKVAHFGVPKNEDIKSMSSVAVHRLFPGENWKTNDSVRAKEHDGMIDAVLIAYWLGIFQKGELTR